MARSVSAVLEEIGSWTNIAHELSKRGITGTPECPDRCPIAKFILGEVSPEEVTRIHVDGTAVQVWDAVGEYTVYDAPIEMVYFIEDFDGGEYPSLSDDPDAFGWLDEGDEPEEDDGPW